MRITTQEKFGLTPCTWQLQSAQYQLEKRDVVMILPTGFDKTLTFWIPLLFNTDGIIVISGLFCYQAVPTSKGSGTHFASLQQVDS